MTYEERAENKWNEIAYKYSRIEDMAYRIIKDDFIKMYLTTLEEGRKDRNCVNCSNHSSNLRKENVELKKQLEKTNEDCAKEILDGMGIVSQRNLKIEQLEKENEELKEKIQELDDVNAKMRCCQNCKNLMLDNAGREWCSKSGIRFDFFECDIEKDWELAK